MLETSGLAPRTVARRPAAVSSWYRFLVAEEVRPGSPAEHVRHPRAGDEGETPGPTRGELKRLLAAADTHGSKRSIALLSLLAHDRAPDFAPGTQGRPQRTGNYCAGTAGSR